MACQGKACANCGRRIRLSLRAWLAAHVLALPGHARQRQQPGGLQVALALTVQLPPTNPTTPPAGEVNPLEFNLDRLNGISFTKGCFVGQASLLAAGQRASLPGSYQRRLQWHVSPSAAGC